MSIIERLKKLIPYKPTEGPPIPKIEPKVYNFLRELDAIEREMGVLTKEWVIEAAERNDLPPMDELSARIFIQVREVSTDIGLERILLQMWGALPKPIDALKYWRETHRSLLDRILGR